MGRWGKDLALCPQVENLKEKLISQAQEVSRLRSELVRGPQDQDRPEGREREGWVSSPGHSSTSHLRMWLSLSAHALPRLMLSYLRHGTSYHRAGGWISFADVKEECELCACINLTLCDFHTKENRLLCWPPFLPFF